MDDPQQQFVDQNDDIEQDNEITVNDVNSAQQNDSIGSMSTQ